MLEFHLHMANIKSKIKRNKQAKKAALRNKSVKSALKTNVIKFNEAVEKKDKKKAEEIFAVTSKAYDKAASKKVLHANRAAAKKSMLQKKLNSLK